MEKGIIIKNFHIKIFYVFSSSNNLLYWTVGNFLSETSLFILSIKAHNVFAVLGEQLFKSGKKLLMSTYGYEKEKSIPTKITFLEDNSIK